MEVAKWDAYYHVDERSGGGKAMGCAYEFNLSKVPLSPSRSRHISVSLQYSPYNARNYYGISPGALGAQRALGNASALK